MKFNIMLKQACYLLVMLTLPMLSFGNGQEDALFSKANNYYSKAQYKDALNTYQQIINNGHESASVYFNMGNASYKDDDLPSAILYYEKAHKLAPGDDDINYNLKYANLKTTDKIDEVPEFFLTQWWKGLILNFSTGTLAAWSILFILLASGILVIYFFAGSVTTKKAAFFGAALFFFLGIAAIFMANRQLSYFDGHPGAIVFSGSVNVKSSPADKSNTLFVIHDGTKVNVLDSSEDWMKISLANGNEGWIKQSDVKEI
jgi:tetratricopeptide (TPR) repeat protein